MKRKREPPIERRRRRIQKLLDEFFLKRSHKHFWNIRNVWMGGMPSRLIKTEKGYRKVLEGIKRIESGDFT